MSTFSPNLASWVDIKKGNKQKFTLQHQNIYETQLEKSSTNDKKIKGSEFLHSVPVWIGRDELVEQLGQEFFQIRSTPDGSQCKFKILLLTGQGGIGKSSLAIKLLETLGVDLKSATLSSKCIFEQIICIKIEENTTFKKVSETLLSNLGFDDYDKLKTEEEIISHIIQILQINSCLILFDQLELALNSANNNRCGYTIEPELGKLLHLLTYSNHNSKIIITSREIPRNLRSSEHENSELDLELILIQNITGVSQNNGVEILKARGLKDQKADLKWISQSVDGHVFLLTQLAAIAKDKPGYLRKHPNLVSKKSEPILKEQFARQSQSSLVILKRMSILNVEIDIDGLTFLRLFQENHEKDFHFIEEYNKYLDFSEEDIQKTQILLDNLTNCSLVESRYDEQKCELFYNLHQVIKEFIIKEYQEEIPNLFHRVYSYYLSHRNIISSEVPKNIQDLKVDLEAQYFAVHIRNYKEGFRILSHNLHKYLKRWGYWNLLRQLYEILFPFIQEYKKPELLNLLGELYSEMGNLDLAEQSFKQALLIAQTLEDESNTERSRLNLELIITIKQQYLLEIQSSTALKNYKQLYGNNNSPTGFNFLDFLENSNNNFYLTQSGSQRKMLQSRLNAYNSFIEKHGKSAIADESFLPPIIELTFKLGCTEIKLGNIEIAEEYFLFALEMPSNFRDIKLTASLLSNLAKLKKFQQNLELARSYYKQAYEIYSYLGLTRELFKLNQEWKETK